MRRRSVKRAAQERLYVKLRSAFLVNEPWCFVAADGCTGLATQVHHMQGRVGDLLNDVSKWLPVCDGCHRQITENPLWAYENGFSLRRIGAA